jgi:RNA-directed DNA polymerase
MLVTTIIAEAYFSSPAQLPPPGAIVVLISDSDLLEACRDMVRRQERYMRELRNDDRRRERRGTSPSQANLYRPAHWSVDDSFDPYHVRSRSTLIAETINSRLKRGEYTPFNPVIHLVPKSKTEFRPVSVFPIADALVSRNLYLSLMSKNKSLMSARSYAYREDLSAHDAIQYVSSEIRGGQRIFVAEYDFSKYFEKIRHKYLWEIIDKYRFLVTPYEKRMIANFLEATPQPQESYSRNSLPQGNGVGLPQGTSISLFLANVAAFELDRSLERLGVGFARYADDILIWSRDYNQICLAANVMASFSESIGAEINLKKSKGISLLSTPAERTEISSVESVDFLGYRMTRSYVGLKDSVVERIKTRVDYIVWSNLLEPLQKGTFKIERVTLHVDRDYQVMIGQLRRYFYGNLTEAKVRELERGAVKRMRYPGLMAHFPLIDDMEQLKALDGWMLNTVAQALKRRTRLLEELDIHGLPRPHRMSSSELLTLHGWTRRGDKLDLRVPSLVRFSSIILRAAAIFGPNVVGRGSGSDAYKYRF